LEALIGIAAAPEGSVYVVNHYRNSKQNMRTQFMRIIRNAGVKPWGRLFDNLRGSLETELAQDHPVHVVAHWLGNTGLMKNQAFRHPGFVALGSVSQPRSTGLSAKRF